MKCLIIEGVKKVAFVERGIPELGENDVLVKIESRGICGTDLSSYRYGMPNGFGHEMAGVVQEVGSTSEFVVGTKVFVSNLSQNLVNYSTPGTYEYMGGFADYIVVRNAKENVDLYPVAKEMTYSEAALVEPFCVGMSGVKKATITKNSKVVILGAGIIGMCAFEYLRCKGVTNIVVCDINETRLEKAKQAGAIAFNTKEGNLEAFLTQTFGQGFSMMKGMVPDVDVYIDAAGVGSLVNEVVGYGKIGAQLTVLAVHHQPLSIDMTNVMYNSFKIIGSCMFSHEDILEAIDLIQKDKHIASTLISHEIPFENAKEGFEIADDASKSLKVMLVG